jgi:hypothetical protein
MKLTLTINIDIPDDGTIHQAENIVFHELQKTGKAVLQQFINTKKMDVEAQPGLRFKGSFNRTLETRFGVINFEKKKFFNIHSRSYESPIIKSLGLRSRQTTTIGLQRLGVDMAIETTYGYARKKLLENCSLVRSKTAIWNDVQKIGKSCLEKQNEEIKHFFKTGEIQPVTKEAFAVVAIEPDETMINSCNNKDSEKHVPRMAIVYTSKKQEGKDRYIVQNKRVIAQIEDPAKFGQRLFHTTLKYFNISTAKQIVMRMDGARWIQSIREEHFPNALWQTDPHHVSEKIKDLKLPEKTEKHWQEHLYKGKPGLLRKDIITLHETAPSDILRKFLGYIDRNFEGLKPLPQRHDKSLPWLERKMFVRGSGAAERNIGDFIVDRMKNQRMRWSVKGANNLLALKSIKRHRQEWNDLWKEAAA